MAEDRRLALDEKRLLSGKLTHNGFRWAARIGPIEMLGFVAMGGGTL